MPLSSMASWQVADNPDCQQKPLCGLCWACLSQTVSVFPQSEAVTNSPQAQLSAGILQLAKPGWGLPPPDDAQPQPVRVLSD